MTFGSYDNCWVLRLVMVVSAAHVPEKKAREILSFSREKCDITDGIKRGVMEWSAGTDALWIAWIWTSITSSSDD